ncbi:MAG: DNA polymerase subunit beta [Limnothrix sp. CACIAM 69d]|nr:MAG: DNA polymerase subunit beta [Limnothrix sp. CACIAM 69d]
MLLCDDWQITEVALFGSILGDRFRDDSDVDLLISFSPIAKVTLLDLYTIECEFSKLFQNRPVDLVTRRAIEQSHNPIRRNNILGTAQVIYRINHQD